jgi:hypothetical protein
VHLEGANGWMDLAVQLLVLQWAISGLGQRCDEMTQFNMQDA